MDIVSIDTGDRSYLFYVNEDDQLAYLVSPDTSGRGEYTVETIKQEKIKGGKEKSGPIQVSKDTKQLAAITWNSNGTQEVQPAHSACTTHYPSLTNVRSVYTT